MTIDPRPRGTGLGFAGSRADALAIWNGAAARWAEVARRPTAGDVAVYRRLAGERIKGRVLILGVTPELRDLVAEVGAPPVLVDSSGAMHEATSRMLRRADPAREIWIEADWCEATLPSRAFDLVLGDMVWWAVSVATQHELRDRIHRALKPEGLFVGRVRFSDPAQAIRNAAEVVPRYLQRLDEPGADPQRIATELLYWLYDHTADHGGRRLDRARTRALLRSLASASRVTRHTEFLRMVATNVVGADWTTQVREELLELFGARFAVVAEECAADYDSARCPIIALRPRENASQLFANDDPVIERNARSAGAP